MNCRLCILIVWLITAGWFITSCRHNQNTNPIGKESKNMAEDNNHGQVNTPPADNAKMVAEVAALGYLEIEMAKAAKQKTRNKTIRNIAALLQQDDMLLMKQLRDYAANRNISIADSATDQDQREVKKMINNTTPAEFDRKWCTELLDKHEMLIAEMEDAATTVTDPGLRAWINDALPKIRVHRDKLMQLKYKLR